MSNQQNDVYHENLEEVLDELPERISTSLKEWRTATLIRKKRAAILYLQFKGEDSSRMQGELKAMIETDPEHYELTLKEIVAETKYEELINENMNAKKRAGLRTQY